MSLKRKKRVLAIDDENRIGEQRRAILVHQLSAACRGRDETKRAAPVRGLTRSVRTLLIV